MPLNLVPDDGDDMGKAEARVDDEAAFRHGAALGLKEGAVWDQGSSWDPIRCISHGGRGVEKTLRVQRW